MSRNMSLASLWLTIIIILPVYAQEFSGRSGWVRIKTGSSEGTVPEIFWINPDEGTGNSETSILTIEAGIKTGSGIRQTSVYLNGKKLQDRGFNVVESLRPENYDFVVSKQLNLSEGANEIVLTVEDNNGRIGNRTRTIRFQPAGLSTGTERKDYALLFATDDYTYWDDLVNPVNDAKAIEDELKKDYGFNTELMTNVTSDQVWAKLKEYAQKSYMNYDQLLIFFAGHGQFDEIFGEGFIVCADSKKDDESKSSYISHVRLRNIVNNIQCPHILLVIDACFGGTFDPVIARAGVRGDEMYGEIPKSEYVLRKLQYRTRRYLTSGGKTYVPDGRPGAHSPFTRKLLEAFRDYGGSDGILTLYDMRSYVDKIQPEPRFGEFGDNEPGSDFIFEFR